MRAFSLELSGQVRCMFGWHPAKPIEGVRVFNPVLERFNQNLISHLRQLSASVSGFHDLKKPVGNTYKT